MRILLVLTNRARPDPDEMLDGCSLCSDVTNGCYNPVPLLQWNEAINHAARFHAINLTYSSCGLRHESSCNLADTIGDDYPDFRDGSVSCACEGGTTDCSPAVPLMKPW